MTGWWFIWFDKGIWTLNNLILSLSSSSISHCVLECVCVTGNNHTTEAQVPVSSPNHMEAGHHHTADCTTGGTAVGSPAPTPLQGYVARTVICSRQFPILKQVRQSSELGPYASTPEHNVHPTSVIIISFLSTHSLLDLQHTQIYKICIPYSLLMFVYLLFFPSPPPANQSSEEAERDESIDCQVVELVRDEVLPYAASTPSHFIVSVMVLLNKGSIESASGTDSGRLQSPLTGLDFCVYYNV